MNRNSSIIATAVLLFLCLVVAPSSVPASPEPFVMTTSVGAPLYKDDGSGLYNQLVRAIFARLGIDYELFWPPSQRSLAYTNNGNYDGNIARTPAIERKQGNLLRVAENVFDFEFMVYAKKADLEISGRRSLDP